MRRRGETSAAGAHQDDGAQSGSNWCGLTASNDKQDPSPACAIITHLRLSPGLRTQDLPSVGWPPRSGSEGAAGRQAVPAQRR